MIVDEAKWKVWTLLVHKILTKMVVSVVFGSSVDSMMRCAALFSLGVDIGVVDRQHRMEVDL